MAAARATGLCIIAPPEGGADGERITIKQQAWVNELKRLAGERGMQIAVFRTALRRSEAREEPGRRFYLLDPWEADRLYRSIHRDFGGVFQAGEARVLRDPIKMLQTSNSVPVSRWVRPKAYFAQHDGVSSALDALAEFETWVNEAHCTSHRDCRVLPMHMFSPNRDWATLGAEAERKAFGRVHGGSPTFKDHLNREWDHSGPWHGNDSLTVGGFALPIGFHWDVTSSRNASRMSSFTETWRFKGNAYVNVSPDGFVRAGQSKGVTAELKGRAPRPEPAVSARVTKKERLQARRARQLKRKHEGSGS